MGEEVHFCNSYFLYISSLYSYKTTVRDAVEVPLLQDKVHPLPPEQQQFCSTSKMQLGVAGTEGGLYPDEKSVEICRLQRITIGHLS